MTRLPPVLWTLREDLAALVSAIGPDAMRWVGGAVRDTLLDRHVEDIDAATIHEPPRVMDDLRRAGIPAVPTGIAHGTVTAVLEHGPVEITTLRRDVSTDGRHATVAFATNWREDAARRDFTINALYAHPLTLEVEDYFGGLEDLADSRIRFIGDARQRIREDHLRILRYFRFQCRFGGPLDEEAEEACRALAPMLKGLSRERVASELLKLLALPDPGDTVERMLAGGILPVILPETDEEQVALLRLLIGREQEHGIAPEAIRRLAALLPADPRLAEQVAARLRLSVTQRKRLASAADRLEPAADARALAYRLGRPEAIDRLLLVGGDPAPLSGWDMPVLPLKGGEIVARGVAAGPEVARILQQVEARWIAEGFPQRERVETLLAECLSR